jgi:hypothetical protein
VHCWVVPPSQPPLSIRSSWNALLLFAGSVELSTKGQDHGPSRVEARAGWDSSSHASCIPDRKGVALSSAVAGDFLLWLAGGSVQILQRRHAARTGPVSAIARCRLHCRNATRQGRLSQCSVSPPTTIIRGRHTASTSTYLATSLVQRSHMKQRSLEISRAAQPDRLVTGVGRCSSRALPS